MIAVLIPTLDRADKLAALVENIHETTVNDHCVYLVIEASDGDTLLQSIQLDTRDVIGKFGSCAMAMNMGYRASVEPFVFTGNDDLKFHHGWDEAALAKMDDEHHIVGTNDGSGDCKCFALVRRSYIEKESGVFDRPNTLWHTYAHLCADTEFAHYAKLRGVWADAPDSLTEHLHWRFGKADPDHPNYVRGRESNADDLAEYDRRREEWDPAHVTPKCTPY